LSPPACHRCCRTMCVLCPRPDQPFKPSVRSARHVTRRRLPRQNPSMHHPLPDGSLRAEPVFSCSSVYLVRLRRARLVSHNPRRYSSRSLVVPPFSCHPTFSCLLRDTLYQLHLHLPADRPRNRHQLTTSGDNGRSNATGDHSRASLTTTRTRSRRCIVLTKSVLVSSL
jgi:hypothetical protein